MLYSERVVLLNFSEGNPAPKRWVSRNLARKVLGIGALAGVIALGSTLAASINLNSGTPVEFGQGVAAATSCDDSIILTPQSTFVNDGDNSDFLFTMLSVSDISIACDGNTFTIKAYKNGENSPLELYETNGTIYDEINVMDVGGSFSFGEGGLESGDIQDITDGFAMTIGAGTQPSVALASAQDVDRITLESKDSVESETVIGPNSLVGLWQFEYAENLGFDSENGINVSRIIGSPVQGSGQYGYGLSLDGDSYIDEAGAINGLPAGNSSYTFTAWINSDGDSRGTGGIVSYGEGSENRCNCLRLNGFNGFWHYWYSNDFGLDAGYSLAGTWHHIASTYDSSTGRRSLYLDGLQLSTEIASQLPDFYGGNLNIGKTNSDVPFKGKIDEIAIYNFALDSNQILSVKNGNY